MRTNIDINDDLMARAMKASGAKTKKATVEKALRLLVRLKGQEEMRALRGRLRWEGDLEESRLSRDFIHDTK